MRARIHRGAHEIGGSCVEVETGRRRLVLDLGRPLTAARDEDVPLPDVAGLAEGDDPSLLGVLVSHSHADHWGLIGSLPANVPVYAGAATARILTEAAFWSSGIDLQLAGELAHRRPFELGPFRITPFLNDHSAFDAYSLLIEAEGRSLFYSGDFRGHGRKAGIFEELLRKPPQPVHALVMEGTNLRSTAGEAHSLTEADLEMTCAEIFRRTAGLGLLTFSAQNVDRLATVYRAALRSDRDLVIDLYTASIAVATGNPKIPHPGAEWPHVKVYVPLWQRVKVKEAAAFGRTAAARPYRVFESDLAADPSRYVVKADRDTIIALGKTDALAGAQAIWSLWEGYLTEPSGTRLTSMLAAHGVPLTMAHTSGHACVSDLQRLAAALAPDRVVPIHTENPERFPELFGTVDAQPDGDWWEV
mgnify:FL=1